MDRDVDGIDRLLNRAAIRQVRDLNSIIFPGRMCIADSSVFTLGNPDFLGKLDGGYAQY